jgi:amino acid transporter
VTHVDIEPRSRSVQPSQHPLRRNAVSLAETIAQSVSVMAPAMSGAFITYLAAIKAGGATPLSFLLATLACLAIGGVVAQFGLRLPSAGSLYTYTTHGLGPLGGFVTGWTYSAAFLFAETAVLAGFAGFMSLLTSNLAAPVLLQQWWLWWGLGLGGYFVLSYFDIRLSTRSQLVTTAATAAVLLLLAIVVIARGGSHGNTLAAFSPDAAGVSWPLVLAGMAFGILSFGGFETAAVLAEETRHPRRNIPLAVMGSVLLGGAFYLVVTYATSIGYGVAAATTEWPASLGGLLPLADRYASYLTSWVLVAGAVSALVCGLGIHNAVARTLYAMGREGVLPSSLGRTHPDHRTPHVAITTVLCLVMAISYGLLAVTSAATREAIGATSGALSAPFYLFTEGLTIASPGLILGYTLLALGGVVYWNRDQCTRGAARRVGLCVAAAVAAGAGLFGSLYYSFVELAPGAGVPLPFAVIPVLYLAWVGLGAATGLRIRVRRPDVWARTGQVFE